MTQFPPPTDFSHGRPKRKGIMLACPYDEARLVKWQTPIVYVQPKLNGWRCWARRDPKLGWQLISSTGNEIISVPHINKELERRGYSANFIPDAELYRHGMSFEEIDSICSRSVNIHPDYESIQLHVFDDKVINLNQTRRLGNVHRILTDRKSNIILPVKTLYASSAAQISDIFQHYVDEKYEGIIVRHPDHLYEEKRSRFMMKFKPKHFDIYKVIGWRQMVDKYGVPKNTLGAFICEKDGQPFGVSGMTDAERAHYWSMIMHDDFGFIGTYIEVGYQHLSGKRKVPLSAVYVRPITREEEPNAKEKN